jgi:hypothetical protein
VILELQRSRELEFIGISFETLILANESLSSSLVVLHIMLLGPTRRDICITPYELHIIPYELHITSIDLRNTPYELTCLRRLLKVMVDIYKYVQYLLIPMGGVSCTRILYIR